MTIRGFALLAVASVFVAVAYCEVPAKIIKLTGKDSGKTVQVNLGDAVEVTLKENPTTGYVWKIASVDEAILKPVDEKEYKSDSNAIGAGGKMTMRFRAVAKGEATLKLIYHRPWEKDKPPAETFGVKFVVQTKS